MNINEEPKNIYRAINELSKTLELEELELVWLLLYTYSFCALN